MVKKYIKEFEKNIGNIDKSKKCEILKEIKSIIEENDTYDSLVKRLGMPSQLADNYTHDLPKKQTIKVKFMSNLQKILSFLFICIAIVIVSIYFFIYEYISDPYDYSMYNYTTIDEKVDGEWVKVNNIFKIDANQAKIVFYGSRNNFISYNCKGNVIDENNKLKIKQASCIVKLSKDDLIIESYQASIKLMHPKNALVINANQSDISIDTKTSKYNFDKLNLSDKSLKMFKSYTNGIKIKGNLKQTKFTRYKH